jgi:hypothetical protein
MARGWALAAWTAHKRQMYWEKRQARVRTLMQELGLALAWLMAAMALRWA